MLIVWGAEVIKGHNGRHAIFTVLTFKARLAAACVSCRVDLRHINFELEQLT